MPVYEFLCEGCGPFEERRAFEEASEAAWCPACGAGARRVYSIPNLKTMPTSLSNAMHRAEKSAHEPEVVRRRPEGGARYRSGHGGHCGH